MNLVEICGNRGQSGTPRGMSQSESESSGSNLTSAGNPSGMNLSNRLPMLGNTTSKKRPSMSRSKFYGIYQHVIQITFAQSIIVVYKFMRVQTNVAKRKMLPYLLLLLRILVLKSRIGI